MPKPEPDPTSLHSKENPAIAKIKHEIKNLLVTHRVGQKGEPLRTHVLAEGVITLWMDKMKMMRPLYDWKLIRKHIKSLLSIEKEKQNLKEEARQMREGKKKGL